MLRNFEIIFGRTICGANKYKKYAQQIRRYANPALQQQLTLHYLDICADPPSRALVLGVYADEDNREDEGILTPTAWYFHLNDCKGRLLGQLRMSGNMPKRGQTRHLFSVIPDTHTPEYSVASMVGLGKECLGYDPYEVRDEQKESIRRSVAAACIELAEMDTLFIDVEDCGHAESAAEGAALGIWRYQDYKDEKKRIYVPRIDLYAYQDGPCDIEGWRLGIQKAAAQNLTRELQEMPSNVLTPTGFAKQIVELLTKTGVNVEIKVEGWADAQTMHGFLAVGRASCEQPIFIELSYYGTKATEAPIVLVGQGITYDTGGLCLKSKQELYNMRGDMTGAAVVVATLRCISDLRLPVNIRGLIPLCENSIGCNSVHPGDIVATMNGRHVEIEGTDHEDMVVIGDALTYAMNFCPKFLVDIGTPSGAMKKTIDESAAGVFTNSEILWQQIKNASMHTGDRVWRMPLWNYYEKLVTAGGRSDVQNYGIGTGGRPCKAAAFLKQYVQCGQWMHIDATSVMTSNGKNFEYLRRGMAGRPTRTLVEFIAQTVCQNTAPKMKKDKPPSKK